MGYVMELVDERFFVHADNKALALKAIKEMMEEDGHRPEDKSYAWMNGKDHRMWTSLEEALEAWRFPAEEDEDGNIVSLHFKGEKLGNEKKMFHMIASYVEEGSYLKFRGGDGDEFKYVFTGVAVIED